MNRSSVGDQELRHVKGMTNLVQLDLWDTRITDDGLVHLKDLTQLKTLALRETQVTDEGVKQLRQELPNCQVVH